MNTAFEKYDDPSRRCRSDWCDVAVLLSADFRLESGEVLSHPELHLRIYGEIGRPIIAVSGGISSGRMVADSDADQGWWREIVCLGGAIDLDKFCVLSFDFLPNSGETARTITTLDQARALAIALDSLKIDQLYSFVGASYGGMTALAFAAAFPDRIERLCVVSAADRPHPAATALRLRSAMEKKEKGSPLRDSWRWSVIVRQTNLLRDLRINRAYQRAHLTTCAHT